MYLISKSDKIPSILFYVKLINASIDCAVREEHSLLATAIHIDSVIGINHVVYHFQKYFIQYF